MVTHVPSVRQQAPEPQAPVVQVVPAPWKTEVAVPTIELVEAHVAVSVNVHAPVDMLQQAPAQTLPAPQTVPVLLKTLGDAHPVLVLTAHEPLAVLQQTPNPHGSGVHRPLGLKV
jgi:hypothetical protein